MVVGEETLLASGKVDLVGCTRDGALVIVELKTGPQNSDFRRVLAQLLDYGSDMWQMSPKSFESTVSGRYFASDYVHDPRLRGATSLNVAARITWDQISEEECLAFADRLKSNLAAGSFNYVLAAQRFTPATLKTIEYLNAAESRGRRFFAVELVRFEGEGLSAFESRTVLKPQIRASSARASSIGAGDFLDGIEDEDYREALEKIFDACPGLDLEIINNGGSVSIRVATPFSRNRITIAWVYPPGEPVYMKLTNLSMGFEKYAVEGAPDAGPVLEKYAKRVSELPGAEPVAAKITASSLRPDVVVSHHQRIVDELAWIVSEFANS